mgnify:CR=1 FL=1
MSVRITGFNKDGTIDVFHDDPGYGHGGVLELADLEYGKGPDGITDDERYIRVPCPFPDCNSVSIHPITGGADPDRIQKLAVIHRMARKDVSIAAAFNWVKDTSGTMERPDRFRFVRSKADDDLANAVRAKAKEKRTALGR